MKRWFIYRWVVVYLSEYTARSFPTRAQARLEAKRRYNAIVCRALEKRGPQFKARFELEELFERE